MLSKTAAALFVAAISSGFILVGQAKAQVNVDGYYRNNGTYVQPHRRTAPDDSRLNNYSYPGNYNPNTGRNAGGSNYGGGGSSYGNNRNLY